MMKKSIAVIGLSRFGLNLVESFSKLNVDLIAVDQDKESVRKAGEIITNVLVCDSTDEEALKDAGIQNVDHAIVAIGQNDKANLSVSIMTILKLKEIGVKEITARADDLSTRDILTLIGADNIVMPMQIASERIANKVASKNVIDYFNIKNEFDVYEVRVSSLFEPLLITELDSRSKYKINILLIERNEKVITPNKDTIIRPNDDIFIFGSKKDIPKITNFFS
ncbi:MAG: TrkA family potassium uptake protein [Acholeplasmataceae bacterium]